MKYMMKNYDRGCSKTSQICSIKLLSELESKFNKLNLNFEIIFFFQLIFYVFGISGLMLFKGKSPQPPINATDTGDTHV